MIENKTNSKDLCEFNVRMVTYVQVDVISMVLIKLAAYKHGVITQHLYFFFQRYHQDSFTKHEPREQGTVPGGHTGQGHGWPDGGFIRYHHGEHHTNRCQ